MIPQKRVVAGRAAGSALALTLALTACSASSDPSSPGPDDGRPVVGGTLRLLATGGNVRTLDPQTNEATAAASPTWTALYSKLMDQDPKTGEPVPALAESIEPNEDATEWTITLREDAMLHEAGRPYDADDAIFSIKRILDPKTGAKGVDALSFIDADGLEKVDDFAFKLNLKQPYGLVREAFATNYASMVPEDFDAQHPDGTGPFTLQKYTPGQSVEMLRFDDYYGEKAFVDKLVITEVADSAAQINALQSGQAEIIDAVPPAQVKAIESSPSLKVLQGPSWQYFPIIMNVDIEPFDDVRVRQALRLIADRQQIVDVALNGYGDVANDYADRGEACPPNGLPQRSQDIDEAKRLLAEAGESDLELDLVTTNGTAGMAETAPVYAEQAKEAGVTINVRNLDVDSYLAKYGQWPFAVDWILDDYPTSVLRTLLPGGAYANAHWDDKTYQAMAEAAFAEADETKRCEHFAQMQAYEYENSPLIVWGFSDTVHAYASDVHGLVPDVAGGEFERLNKVWISN